MNLPLLIRRAIARLHAKIDADANRMLAMVNADIEQARKATRERFLHASRSLGQQRRWKNNAGSA